MKASCEHPFGHALRSSGTCHRVGLLLLTVLLIGCGATPAEVLGEGPEGPMPVEPTPIIAFEGFLLAEADSPGDESSEEVLESTSLLETASGVDVSVEAPEEVDPEDTISVTVTVTNKTTEPLADVQLHYLPGPGLTFVEENQPKQVPVAELAPGKSREYTLKLHAERSGNFTPMAEVYRGEELLASDWDGLQVTGPIEDFQMPERKEPELGPPLVDRPEDLQRLLPDAPVYFDRGSQAVVVQGFVCLRKGMLELFACLRGTKEHESIITVPVPAFAVHTGLTAAGAEPGTPVQFRPEFSPASGPEIEVTLVWMDADGKRQRARAQDWIRNMNTGEPMNLPFVFAGSLFYKNEESGEESYVADGDGALICVTNFPSAVLDVPAESVGFDPQAVEPPEASNPDNALQFEAFEERIPPEETPVTMILTPKRTKRKRGQATFP